jgi:peptidyl-tRNA hydrolase, PTH1 family
MWLIVGLGNPGGKYLLTRHNAGFMALDFLCKSVGVKTEDARHEHNAVTTTFNWEAEQIKLAKSETFMNLSGDSISPLLNFYKIPLDHLIVVHDELDLPFGRLQIKLKGGDGGHNGVGSLIEKLGSDEFIRVRVGIGRSPIAGMDPADWVLQKFSKDEQERLPEVLNVAVDAIESIVFDGVTKAMNTFNKKA